MREDTRHTIHLGVNFVFSPKPDISGRKHLDFQARLAEEQIEFDQAVRNAGHVVFVKSGPRILQVRVGGTDQPEAPLGQLLVIAKANLASGSVDAGVSIEDFKLASATVCETFHELWPGAFQIASQDAAVHMLYDSGHEHAFSYLWEEWLGQDPEKLAKLGRQVLGGGLRFVMPPVQGADDRVMLEVKIESFLREPRKLYIEAQMAQPMLPGAQELMEPNELVDAIIECVDERVIPFIQG